jgi:hypothetical protein
MKYSRTLFAFALLGAIPAGQVAARDPAAATSDYAVGPQYDTTHVYVAPGDFDRFVASLIATFGGTATTKGAFQVTPTTSKTFSQLVLTPAGSISVFGFTTPVPFPFGDERNGYLVTDLDAAVHSAVKAGATRRISIFPDPIGRDAVVQWPGGVNMQLYWHTKAPNYPTLATVPENRVYLTPDSADAFVRSWNNFARGRVVSDDRSADGGEIGQPAKTYRRIRITARYGKTTVMVSDNQLPWPYGRETTGYEVSNLQVTLAKAIAAGVETLIAPHAEQGRQSAIVRFPGGYIAEIHSAVAP